MKQKIFSLEKLQKIIAKEKVKKKKIVLCHGVFDILHIEISLLLVNSLIIPIRF